MAGQIQHVGVSPGSRAGVGPNRPTRAAICLRAAIRDGEMDPLQLALYAADADVRTGRSPLMLLEAVHFARWTIVPGDHSLVGGESVTACSTPPMSTAQPMIISGSSLIAPGPCSMLSSHTASTIRQQGQMDRGMTGCLRTGFATPPRR